MPGISSEEARRIYDALPERSWSGLMDMLEHRHAPDVRQAVIDLVVMEAGELDAAGEDFPENAQQFYRMLSEAIEERTSV